MGEEEIGRMGPLSHLPPLIFSGELGHFPYFSLFIIFTLFKDRAPFWMSDALQGLLGLLVLFY
jgi:hypothetical protein